MYSWRVPLTTYGELKIIPVHDLGDLITEDIKPTIFNWRITYHIHFGRLLLWIILFVLLLALKENRKRGVWLILFLIFLAFGLCQICKEFFLLSAAASDIFFMILRTLVLIWSILLLFGERLGKCKLTALPFIILCIMFMGGIMAGISQYAGIGFDMKEIITIYGTGVAAIILGSIFTSYSCRKRQNIWLFMLWQFIRFESITMICLSVYTVIIIIHDSIPHHRFSNTFIKNIVFGLQLGIVLYMMSLPYMVAVFKTELYQKRFCRLFQI